MMWIAFVRSGRRLTGYTFKREELIGFKQCLKSCYVHTDCLSVNFSVNRLLCELNSQQETDIVQVKENSDETGDFIYVSRNSFSQEIQSLAGRCSNTSCHSGKRCIPLSLGGFACVITRCLGEPLPVHYGYSASLHASLYNGGFFSSESYVGKKRKYTCANGTVPVGGNQVTCLANGQWEKPIFKCQVCTAANDTMGERYWGTVNVTINNRSCQRWDTTSPHNHSFIDLEENYCRNPDQEPRPWCYTTDPSRRWELCDVPLCN